MTAPINSNQNYLKIGAKEIDLSTVKLSEENPSVFGAKDKTGNDVSFSVSSERTVIQKDAINSKNQFSTSIFKTGNVDYSYGEVDKSGQTGFQNHLPKDDEQKLNAAIYAADMKDGKQDFTPVASNKIFFQDRGENKAGYTGEGKQVALTPKTPIDEAQNMFKQSATGEPVDSTVNTFLRSELDSTKKFVN